MGNVTDDQIRALLDLINDPIEFERAFPVPPGETLGSWRIGVATDCYAALGLVNNGRVLSEDANREMNDRARERITELLAGRKA